MVTTVTDNSPQAINTSLFSLDKEVQEIKKVTDKLAGINTESGVISVNGKQGIVELTASDVDALPSSTVIPTTTSELENTSGFITASSDITGNAATATTANKIEPSYTSVALTIVSSDTTKYIKVADCHWYDAGTLQVYLRGDNLADTLVLNFGGGNATTPMLCGHYTGNSSAVLSVIAKRGSNWNSDYSIYIKVNQLADCTVSVALLTGSCTIGISETTTAPTNINEWAVSYGLFGNITSPEITSLEQRVADLESKI